MGKELRMRATRLFPTIFALSVLLSAHAVGETLGDARVGFSAERLLVVDGRSGTVNLVDPAALAPTDRGE